MANLPAASGAAGPGEFRASDADRDRVAEALRQAAGEGRLTLDELDARLSAAFAAKTFAELAPLVRDLPAPVPLTEPGPLTEPAAAQPATAFAPTSRFAMSIMGGFHRRGTWRTPRTFTAFTLMGGGTIDLREAVFTEGRVTITAVAVMGGIEVIVPDDALVDAKGLGIMGGVSHGVRGEGSPAGPRVAVRALALMGGVNVKRRRRARKAGPSQPKPDDGETRPSIAD